MRYWHDGDLLEAPHHGHVVRGPAPIDEAVVSCGSVGHPDFLVVTIKECVEIDGCETGLLYEALVLDGLGQLVVILVVCVALEDLVTELLHYVEVGRVYQAGRNDLKTLDAREFDAFVVKDVDLVVGDDDEAIHVYCLSHLLPANEL